RRRGRRGSRCERRRSASAEPPAGTPRRTRGWASNAPSTGLSYQPRKSAVSSLSNGSVGDRRLLLIEFLQHLGEAAAGRPGAEQQSGGLEVQVLDAHDEAKWREWCERIFLADTAHQVRALLIPPVDSAPTDG